MTRRTTTLSLATITLFIVMVMAAAPALAHVELVSSTPEQGSTVTTSVDTIDLVFSAEAAPAGDGVVVIDDSEQLLPAAVSQPTPDTVRIVVDEPLDGGVFGVIWTMKAGDAHPKTGSVTFRVDSSADSSGSGGGPGTATSDPARTTDGGEILDLDLPDEPSTFVADWVARLGRLAAVFGALVGVGAFAFAATSLVGSRREVLEAAFWVRRGGVLVIVGTLIEVVGTASAIGASSGLGQGFIDTVSGAFAVSVALRFAGGMAMVHGTSLRTRPAASPAADASRLPAPRLGGGSATTIAPERHAPATEHRLDIHGDLLAVGGLLAVVVAFLFDGHTATADPAFLVRLASLVHVIAAGIWVGGVVLMGQVLLRRRRAGVALDAAPMVLRFSRVASLALAAVGVAGLTLTWSILDTPTELVTTSWGRLLLLKVALVGVAASLGAYNHFLVVPVLESDHGHEGAAERIRKIVRIEGVVLLAVVAVTAVLVGAAS